MHRVSISALRGALGFGLGAMLILLYAESSASSVRMSEQKPPEFAGRWVGNRSANSSAVRVAELRTDGTFSFEFGGATVEGAYVAIDNLHAKLERGGSWTQATLNARGELHLLNDTGTLAQVLVRQSSAPIPLVLLPAWLLPSIAAAVAAVVMLLGTGGALRGAMGFGIGAVPAAFVVLFTHISIQGGGQPSYAWGATGCGIGLALMGIIGGASIRPALILPGASAFGLSGAVGGYLSFRLTVHPTSAPYSVFILLLPFVVGGLLFGAAYGLAGAED